MNSMSQPVISVVIPAFNEAERIGRTLERVSAYLQRAAYDYEVIVVDDGSGDQTVRVVEEAATRDPRVRLLQNGGNRGKGYSVRHGALSARGRYVLFSDADLSTPIEELERFLPLLESGTDIVIGSRRSRGSRIESHQPWYRERLLGAALSFLVRHLMTPGIRDTQCGFKCFTNDAAQHLFRQQRMERFSFDIELLYVARKSGYKIREVGIRWLNDPRTRVDALRDSVRIFVDLGRIKLNDWRGLYRMVPPANSLTRPS